MVSRRPTKVKRILKPFPCLCLYPNALDKSVSLNTMKKHGRVVVFGTVLGLV